MAIETELKLRIAPEHMARLKRHPLLRSLAVKRPISRKLYSIYFDTPDLELHQAAMALRLRRAGKQWLQTLKGGGGVQAGLHQRHEWETPVSGERLDFAALDAIGARPLSTNLRKKIEPVFVTDFTRSIRLLDFEGALIEMGLDSGEIRAGKSSHIISEVELELKSGEPLQLFRLALTLLDIVPVEIEAISKAEYGYRLRNPVQMSASKAKVPQLNQGDTLKDALQSAIVSCMTHLQSNLAGVVRNEDEEYLHQVRVALRRLRVVLGIAAKQIPDAELDALRGIAGELGTALGDSREWDVFVTQTLPSLEKGGVPVAALQTIIRRSKKRRQRHHQTVQIALNSGELQRLLLRLGAWMNGAYWRTDGDTVPISSFAVEVLQKRKQKVMRRGENIAQETAAKRLHALRIACKGLRYSTDMLCSLYALEKTRPYLEILARLQDILGALNDNTVALRLLEEVEQGMQDAVSVLIRNKLKRNNARLLTELRKTWKRFSAQTDFWI